MKVVKVLELLDPFVLKFKDHILTLRKRERESKASPIVRGQLAMDASGHQSVFFFNYYY